MRVSLIAVWAAGCSLLYSCGLPGVVSVHFSLLHGSTGVLLGAAGVFLALAAPQAVRACLVIGWLCLWFTTGLAELRAAAITDGIVVGGIIPYSDACNYLQESSRLIEGHSMTAWGSRRPLADAYLSGFLYAAGGRVTLAVALAGAFLAAAIGIAATELRRRMGFIAAVVWTWLLLFYCRRYVGELMSEQAGLALGSLAVAFLVRAFDCMKRAPLCMGLFVLSLALGARAGAFIVLPTLLIAACWQWRRSRPVRTLLVAGLGIAAAFVLNFAFVKILGPPNGKIVSNYHNFVYGMVFGGTWHQAAADIPNYSQMDEPTQAAEVYRRVGKAVKENPWVIFRGISRSWLDFFGGSYQGLGPFSFLRNPRIEVILLGLSGLSLVCSFATWHRLYPVILAGGTGIILSVPFLPTADADLMRIYAATIPLMLLLPVFWVAGWGRLPARFLSLSTPEAVLRRQECVPESETVHRLNYWALPYLFILLAVPLFARFCAPIGATVRFEEKGAETELTVDLDHTSWIELTPSPAGRDCSPKKVLAGTFRGGMFGSFRGMYPKQAALLDSVARPGVVLAASGSTGIAYLVIDARHLEESTGVIKVLGRLVSSDPYYTPSFLEKGVAQE